MGLAVTVAKTGSLRWLWLSALVIVLDQVSKHAVVGAFQLYESVNLLPFFNLTYVHNTGAAFSFLHDAGGWQRWFFSGLAAVISVGLVVWLKQLPRADRWNGIALALVLGGALGNFYDRLVYGYVIDFIDWYVGAWHWPAFNIADAAICVGAVMLVVDSFRKKPAASAQAPASKQ